MNLNVGRYESVVILKSLGPGRYVASGAYAPEGAPAIGLPIEWSANLARVGDKDVYEGVFRHHIGTPAHPFRLEIRYPGESLGRGAFELACPHVPQLLGQFRVVGGGIVFAGQSADAETSLTMNVEVFKAATLDCKGVLFRKGQGPCFFWFSAHEMPTQATKANVLGLHARRGE